MQHSKTSSCKAGGTSCHPAEIGLSLSHQASMECVCKCPWSLIVVYVGELARHLQQNVAVHQVFTMTTTILISGSSICITSARACCDRWLWQTVRTGRLGQSGSGQSLDVKKNKEGKKAHFVGDV